MSSLPKRAEEYPYRAFGCSASATRIIRTVTTRTAYAPALFPAAAAVTASSSPGMIASLENK